MGASHILLQLFIGGLVGLIINWILSRIILQKITSNRVIIAKSIGQEAGQFISAFSITDKLKDPAGLERVKPIIESHVDTFLHVKLQEKMPAIAMFVSGSTLDKLKDGLLEEIDILLPEVIAGYAENIMGGIDVKKLVAQKIQALPAADFKSKLKQLFGRELNYLVLAGAITGMAIAAIQMVISFGGIWLSLVMSE